jgi:aspartyl-tRNA(Asn)/glutamyl-tRNA(Gln) amidotransferase subunit A
MTAAPDGSVTDDGATATGSARRGADSTTSESRFVDSIATAEFAAARERLRAFAIGDGRRPLPLTYRPGTTGSDAAPPTGETTSADTAGSGSIGRALAELDSGKTTCVGLVDDALRAVGQHDPELNAVVELLAGSARARAAELDAELADGRPLRPLHGIPVTVKDVIDVAGVPTRCGSEAYDDVPALDAEGVARLRSAGAIVLAKVTTHEFALGVTSPQSRNPHDPTRIPGGSSGGSAIAVATGMGLGSLGTDTRASIRVPAALSGIVGFKPTFGRVPTQGVVSLSWTMDHVAPMASSVSDAARLLAVLLGDVSVLPTVDEPDSALSGQLGRRLRIGVPTAAFAGADADIVAAVTSVVDGLDARGHATTSIATPSAVDLDDANAIGLLISRTEAATFHRGIGTDLDRCWVEIADQLRAAGSIPAVDYLDAQRARAALAERFRSLFADHDLLAMPTTPVVAPPSDAFADYLMVLARNAIPWSLVGFPAVSIPCGRSSAGLPMGIQLVAAPGADALLVAAGRVVEEVVAGR